MLIETSAFKKGQPIPAKYTCSGENVSPPLSFRDVPANAKSLVLIVDDPDAPKGTFDHWILWDIPPTTKNFSEGAFVGQQGLNHYNEKRYRGPCPPPGKPHRYFFKLYALDTLISLPEGSTKNQVEEAMKEHILAKAELMGTFQR